MNWISAYLLANNEVMKKDNKQADFYSPERKFKFLHVIRLTADKYRNHRWPYFRDDQIF